MASTTARKNAKTGIMEHKHDSFGYHWASAGHRDDGEIHKAAGADKPDFVDGMTATDKENYGKALRREAGHVAQIPSKAKDKSATPAKSDGTEPAEKAETRQPAGSRA